MRVAAARIRWQRDMGTGLGAIVRKAAGPDGNTLTGRASMELLTLGVDQ